MTARDRRMWPAEIGRAALDPYYARAEAALRVQRPTWKQVAKSGGLWAATLDAAGHTCDRVPVAIDLDRCVQAKWCHTGCIFAAKNSRDHQLPGVGRAARRARSGPNCRPSWSRRARRGRTATSSPPPRSTTRARTRRGSRPATTIQIECKVLILSAGAMGNAPLLMRSRPALPSLSTQVGKHLGVNGDHIAGVEYDEQKVKDVLGLPGYGEFYKGNHITTMSYDWWVGRSGHQYDGKRFTLQEIYLSALAHALYDDARDPSGDRPGGACRRSRGCRPGTTTSSCWRWSRTRTTGRSSRLRRTGAPCSPNAGPLGVGPFKYELSDQSIAGPRGRQRGDAGVVQRAGLGALHEADVPELVRRASARRLPDGRVRRRRRGRPPGEVFGNEGLFCIDSSAIPTSLGVNPSLTISAVSERALES